MVLGALMSDFPLFRDRIDAGEQLAQAISFALTQPPLSTINAQPIVYALPRGGIPVGLPVAQLLQCPLSILVAKKISHPKNPELAIGAVSADGNVLWAEETPFYVPYSRLGKSALADATAKAQEQLAQLTPACPKVDAEGAIAIIVDDGIATGMTIAVAAQALKAQNPAAILLCAPLAPRGLISWLEQWGSVIVLETPQSFMSVSRFYAEFPQVETEEAFAYLLQHREGVRSDE
ncbi:phosphoribosyltransferase [Gloeocapsopsis crepidinum LEGE 06123]|uniref:Phosphoribosyltransferase n=2 Tax=Gloeocapsopsis crepidinum TaxID=693223 RepID=A0ABR9UUH1_9CHRO|nr:phosphoribosyltransferase [Gloeocapsopsis crepidinum LEGE 06123]